MLYCDTRFAIGLLYYGLSLNVDSFGLNVYLTQFVFSAVEVPANLGTFFLIQRFGRRRGQAWFLLFGGAACLVILAIPNGIFQTVNAKNMIVILFHFEFAKFSPNLSLAPQTSLLSKRSLLFWGNLLPVALSPLPTFTLQNYIQPL